MNLNIWRKSSYYSTTFKKYCKRKLATSNWKSTCVIGHYTVFQPNHNENTLLQKQVPKGRNQRFSSKQGYWRSRKWLNTFQSPKYVMIYAAMFGGGVTYYNLIKVRQQLHEAVPFNQCIINKSKNQYIYPVDPEETSSFLKQHFGLWWPLSLVTRPIAWQLFDEIRFSSDVNDDKIRTFAKLSNLLESECSHFSLCMDLQTAISLARNGADPRLFITPRLTPKDNTDYYGNKFRYIFSNLSSDEIHESLNTLLQATLKVYNPTEKEQEDRSLDYYSGFESDFHLSQNPVKIMGENDFLKICLQGIVSHSRIYSRIKELLKYGILDVLVSISREYENDVEIMSLVLKVLANLSCDTSSALAIKDSGCLKIIAENSLDKNIKLALPAKRALHNLDRRNNSPILPSGVYQLHPEYGCDECSFKYDIIFIHGLLGGVFRTWRRQDVDPFAEVPGAAKIGSQQHLQNEQARRVAIFKSRMFDLRSKSPMVYNPTLITSPDENVIYPSRKKHKDGSFFQIIEDVPLEVEEIASTPTQCWPRDWLPTDCPTSRIIAVDFESFVTRWMNICPVESVERRLRDRSAELLKKLKNAGVGERPVVWVTHSMGGLLLKSLLCQADDSADTELHKISENTKGVVFCSVPHHGTQMVVLNTARRWLFLPTEEIEELSNEGNQLTELNYCFKRLYDKHKFKVLSYGEILETRTGLGMKFKLVPFASSDIGFGEFYPLLLDHLSTCKPWSRGSFMYRKTVSFIKEVCSMDSVTTLASSEIKDKSIWISGQLKEQLIGVKERTDKILEYFEYFLKRQWNGETNNSTTEAKIGQNNVNDKRDKRNTTVHDK